MNRNALSLLPTVCVCVLGLLDAKPAAAQSNNSAGLGSSSVAAAPAPPEAVMTRDANGRVIIRATRITKPIKIDGKLDDEVYNEVPAITEFVQQEPKYG